MSLTQKKGTACWTFGSDRGSVVTGSSARLVASGAPRAPPRNDKLCFAMTNFAMTI